MILPASFLQGPKWPWGTFLFVSILFISCDAGPKVIVADESSSSQGIEEGSLPVFEDIAGGRVEVESHAPKPGVEHHIVVKDVLTTEKYAYLKAIEGEQSYWVAISKMEVEIGESYMFKGGLLKKNFYSREFDRVFETVYLVSSLWKKNDKGKQSAQAKPVNLSPSPVIPDLKVGKISPTEGAITLAQLFAEKTKYQNQLVKITGKVVKVNPKILNRNWLHLQDGSGDGLDLTVTTQMEVPLGAVVSLEGTITLDKDFGAGYRYDIIMEGAVLK